jgi:hypothetical protein
VKTATGTLKTKRVLTRTTRRKNETINQTPSTSMDYEKHFGSEDSQPDGSQRLGFTLCPGKSFKENSRR